MKKVSPYNKYKNSELAATYHPRRRFSDWDRSSPLSVETTSCAKVRMVIYVLGMHAFAVRTKEPPA